MSKKGAQIYLSFDEIKNADVDQLAGVEGMTLKSAQAVYDFFKSQRKP